MAGKMDSLNYWITRFAHLLRFGGLAILLLGVAVFVPTGMNEMLNLTSDMVFVLWAFGIALEVFYHILEERILV